MAVGPYNVPKDSAGITCQPSLPGAKYLNLKTPQCIRFGRERTRDHVPPPGGGQWTSRPSRTKPSFASALRADTGENDRVGPRGQRNYDGGRMAGAGRYPAGQTARVKRAHPGRFNWFESEAAGAVK